MHACTQFHGEPRVNLVAQHPIPQSVRVVWPSTACVVGVAHACASRLTLILLVHVCLDPLFLTKSNTEHLKNGGQEEKWKQFIVATMQKRGRDVCPQVPFTCLS